MVLRGGGGFDGWYRTLRTVVSNAGDRGIERLVGWDRTTSSTSARSERNEAMQQVPNRTKDLEPLRMILRSREEKGSEVVAEEGDEERRDCASEHATASKGIVAWKEYKKKSAIRKERESSSEDEMPISMDRFSRSSTFTEGQDPP